MTIQVFKLYIQKDISEYGDGKIAIADFDLSKSYNGKPSSYVLLGTIDQEIDVPDIDTHQLQIDALESCVQIERAESQSRVNILLDRISKLKAIGHESSVSEG
jgi:hypothetical protein